jgi:hypothetical protein
VKKRLTAELENAHSQIAAIHNQKVAAIELTTPAGFAAPACFT